MCNQKNEEAQLLKKEMTDDLVRQIIRRLNAISNRSNTSTSDATDTTTK